MRVLAVDTSSERGSVCVMEGHERSECEPGRAKQGIHEPSECESDRAKQVIEVLGEIRIASSIQYSERLFRSIEFLFHYLPFELSGIDLFAAACGPGSFTGLRVGLAAMEGFVMAHRKPGAGVTTLPAATKTLHASRRRHAQRQRRERLLQRHSPAEQHTDDREQVFGVELADQA